MTIMDVSSYAAGEWVKPGAGARNIASAVTGERSIAARTSAGSINNPSPRARPPCAMT